MNDSQIKEELKKVKELLLLEKEEDLKQYKEQLQTTSFHDRRKQGICWYPIQISGTRYDAAERLHITLERPKEHQEEHAFQSGKLVCFFPDHESEDSSKNPIQGVVSQVKDQEMTIATSLDDLPEWTQVGKLGVQLLFDENTYRQMEKALDKVIESKDDRIAELSQILLGEKEASFRETPNLTLPQLNDMQNVALNRILSAEDVTIVHGPPGTGKTTTLVSGIIQLLKTEKQILVCAPSNAAVDLLVEKLTDQHVKTLRLGHPARINERIASCTMDAQIRNHVSFKDLKKVKKQAEEFRKMAGKYKRKFGPEERQQRKLLRQEARQYIQEAKRLAEFISDDIIRQSQVIATTLIGASRYEIAEKQFDTVIIDEAGQSLEAACWIPILKSKKVIFAGDHFQLPPTVKSFEAAQKGMTTTLFEKTILRKQVDTMLEEQYRMNEQIMQFSNQQFYQGKLKAHSSIANHLVFPEDQPVEFIDTAGTGYFEENHPEDKSISNAQEGALLIKHLDEYLGKLPESHGISRIGVISPYRGQINWLKDHILEVAFQHPHCPKIDINTIDSFQGQECDVIYISLARSNEEGTIGFLKDTRRMNVALTRARKKLIVFGDSATICSHPFYAYFVDYINEIGAYRSAFEWMY